MIRCSLSDTDLQPSDDQYQEAECIPKKLSNSTSTEVAVESKSNQNLHSGTFSNVKIIN